MRKTVTTSEGIPVAEVTFPDGWNTSARIINQWQSEMVPFTAEVTVSEPDQNIVFRTVSKQICHDVRSVAINAIISLVLVHTRNGYEKYPGQDEYFLNKAREFSGMDLVPLEKSMLPVTAISGSQAAQQLLQTDLDLIHSFLEIPPKAEETVLETPLYRYMAIHNGHKYYVYAAGDWQYARLSYLSAGMPDLSAISEDVRRILEDKVNLDLTSAREFTETLSNVLTGKEKMTFSDYMHGGILGKMRRNKACDTGKPQKAALEVTVSQPKEKPAPHTIFGTQRSYFCLTPEELDEEALTSFIVFASSVIPDSSLSAKSAQQISDKMLAIRQQAAASQQMAMQKQLQLRQQQARTAQMIARNSAQASAGLMDSWNRRMASQDRISQSYSEAVRGVNSYTNSYGQSVDVSTAADHVYENSYGDVYGISGNALDNEILARLSWKKIG